MQRLNSTNLYSEIYEILNILGKDFIDKIPKKMYNLIDEERDKDYMPNILQEDGLLDESKISQEAIALFAVLNVKYFMNDETQKQEFMNTLKENEEKYQAELREKYNPDEIFGKKEVQKVGLKSQELENNLLVEVKKKTFFEIMVNFFKKIFNIS